MTAATAHTRTRDAAGPAGPTGPEQPRAAAMTPHPGGGQAIAAGPALAPSTEQPAAGAPAAPDTAGPARGGPAGPASTAGTDQPGATPTAPGLTGRTRSAPTPIAPQQAAGTAIASGAIHPIGAITDKRAPQPGHRRGIEGPHHIGAGALQHRYPRRLGPSIGIRGRIQRRDKPAMKHRRLRADRLIGLPMTIK